MSPPMIVSANLGDLDPKPTLIKHVLCESAHYAEQSCRFFFKAISIDYLTCSNFAGVLSEAFSCTDTNNGS